MIIANASLFQDLQNDALAELEKSHQQTHASQNNYSQQRLSSPTDSIASFAVSERHHGRLYFPNEKNKNNQSTNQSPLRQSPLRQSPLHLNSRPWPDSPNSPLVSGRLSKSKKTNHQNKRVTIPLSPRSINSSYSVATERSGTTQQTPTSPGTWAEPLRVVRVSPYNKNTSPSLLSPRSAPPRRRERIAKSTTKMSHNDASHKTLQVVSRIENQNTYNSVTSVPSNVSNARRAESVSKINKRRCEQM